MEQNQISSLKEYRAVNKVKSNHKLPFQFSIQDPSAHNQIVPLMNQHVSYTIDTAQILHRSVNSSAVHFPDI